MAAANISDQALTELFLDMLAAERGGARNTLAAYARDLADLSAFLGESRRSIADASTEDLRDYLSSLGRRGFAAASVARRLSAMRQLYRFLYAEGKRADDPSAIIEGPKRGRSLPKVLSIGDVDRLLAVARTAIDHAAEPGEKLRAARLACLIEVLYATGLRVSELVALPISAAARNARMLVVRGKGDKERMVPLNDAAKTTMRDYLALLADAGTRQEIEMAVSLVRRERPPHAPALRARPQDAGGRGGAARGRRQPARAAPCVREPPPAQRRRPARRADAARPCRHLHHADLHARPGRAAQEPGARPASARRDLGTI